jgi:phosphate transport system substrate-binding protein
MTRRYASRILVVVGLVVAAVLPANAIGAATVVKGAGSDSADPLIGEWQKAVAAAPFSTTIDYSADGSGLGRDEFIKGKTDFVVSGIPFTTAEDARLTTKKKTYVYAPFAGGALAFLYHLNNAQGEPIKGLQLSGATLTKIFTGVVTNWDDPEIMADNPGIALPPKKITPTVRGQADAATYAATSFFKFSAPSVWKSFMEDPQRGFPDEPSELYPFFAGADSRTSSFAIADVVGASEGGDTRITYVDNAWAKKATSAGADIVKVKNVSGAYVLPTPAGAAKTIAAWKINDRNLLGVDYVAATDPTAYPVAMVNYLVIPTSEVTPEVAAGIGTFAKYGLETGQAAAAGVGDPALPAPIVTKSLAVVAAAIPTTATTTTTSTTTAPATTEVSGADLTNGSGGDTGPSLALTGGPDFGLLLGAGGMLVAAGGWLRRRASR